MKSITFLLSILLLISCSDTALQQELADTKEKLAAAEIKLAEINTDTKTTEYPLVHVVYFNLKSDEAQTTLVSEINKLKDIEVLHDLEIGTFKDLNDKRALSDYQIVMSMAFANEADYKMYQEHGIHLGLKKAAKDLLAGPPATYDYMK